MIKKIILSCIMIFILAACNENTQSEVATFESVDMANKVTVLLSNYQISASIKETKEVFHVYVDSKVEGQARSLLTRFNFYFIPQNLNDLLESKFASLSKLENIKSNLLTSREINNNLGVIPDIIRANVIVTGDKEKHISVLIMSFEEVNSTNKSNIDKFLKGVIGAKDTLTVSYFISTPPNE